MAEFAYPLTLSQDSNDTLLVTCADLPEVTTYGADESEAVLRGVDAIEEALAARISGREDIPLPSRARSRPLAVMAPQTVATVLLYLAMRDQGVRKADLARKLSAHGPQVDRLLDLRHSSAIRSYQAAFAALDKRRVIGVESAT